MANKRDWRTTQSGSRTCRHVIRDGRESPSIAIIEAWIETSNRHDTDAYLQFFTDDPTIDDPSVGDVFPHREGVREYFETYVVGYNTQTRIVSIAALPEHVHVEVEFTGDFPERRLGGIFDITFQGERIAFIHADLKRSSG